VWTSEATGDVSGLAVSPNGEMVLAGNSDGTATVMSASDGTTQATFTSSLSSAFDGAGWTGSGYCCVVSGSDLFAFDPSDGSEVWSHTLSSSVDGLEVLGDAVFAPTDTDAGKTVVGSGESAVRVFENLGSPYNGYGTTYSADVAGVAETTVVYDAPQGKEMNLTDGLLEMVEMTDSSGNTVESTNWEKPEYDTVDTQAWTDYLKKTSEFIVEEEYYSGDGSSTSDDSLFGGLFSGDGGGGIVGLAIVGGVLALVLGWVTDLIPGVGN